MDFGLALLLATFVFGIILWYIGLILDKYNGDAADPFLFIELIITLSVGSLLIILGIAYFMCYIV